MTERVAWITGAGGLIGSHLARAAAEHAPGWRVVPLTRDQLELTDTVAVKRRFAEESPALILHCAALSRSAACEADPALARRWNIEVTEQLSLMAGGIPFIFFSTDLVFDGRKGGYVETDPVNPLTVYAQTKAEAERRVLRNPLHAVVRLSVNTGVSPTGDRSFTEQMRLAWRRGEILRLFTDEFRSPLAAAVTARAAWELVRCGGRGLYHLGGSERLSRWEIGQLILTRCPEFRAQVERGLARDFPGPPRALDTSMDVSRIQSLLSFRLPGLTEWIRGHPEDPLWPTSA